MYTQPYIGITGITTQRESEALVQMAESLGWPQSHGLMVGVLASYKGLSRGCLANPRQYVAMDRLDEVLVDDGRLLNLIHYNSRASGLYGQLREVLQGLKCVDGLQLNIAWPDPRQLDRLRSHHYAQIVLQVGATAYRMVGATPDGLLRALQPYAGLIERVLIDPSGGTGQVFDRQFARTILRRLVESDLPMRWGIAGGLGPDNLYRLEDLLSIYPQLSWDAQARLRNDKDGLDLAKCRYYLEASLALIR